MAEARESGFGSCGRCGSRTAYRRPTCWRCARLVPPREADRCECCGRRLASKVAQRPHPTRCQACVSRRPRGDEAAERLDEAAALARGMAEPLAPAGAPPGSVAKLAALIARRETLDALGRADGLFRADDWRPDLS